MTLQWKNPPTSRAATLDGYADDAKALRTEPNRWAVLDEPEGKINLVTAVKAGEGPFAPKGDFQARKVEGEVYVRYVGQLRKDGPENPVTVDTDTDVVPTTEPW